MPSGQLGDPEGIGHLERSLAIRREIGDRIGEAQAANNLADAYQCWDGRMRLSICTGVRWTWTTRSATGTARASPWSIWARRCSTSTEPRRPSITCCRPADIFAEIDYVDGAGYALHILGRGYLSLGRDAEALDSLRQALASHRATGNRRRQAATLRSLGTAQCRAGLTAEARESWAQAAAIFEELGDSAEAAEVRAEQEASGIS